MTILWHDGFSRPGSRKNFMAWHEPSAPGHKLGPNRVTYNQMPDYAHPSEAGAELYPYETYENPTNRLDLIELIDTETRFGQYACRCTVKNAANEGGDDNTDNGDNGRRRTELTSQIVASAYYDLLPLYGTRWLSQSFFVPANWEHTPDTPHWGPSFMQIKPANDNFGGPCLAIGIQGHSWSISTVFSEELHGDFVKQWPHTIYYTNDIEDKGDHYPSSGNHGSPAYWPQGASQWENEAVGPGMLGNVNKGGWTDFVQKWTFDHRGEAAGGQGRLEIWMRHNLDAWVKILNIVPMDNIDRDDGGFTYNAGTCFNSPANEAGQPYTNGGFGYKLGLYVERETVEANPINMEILCANFKVGDENTVFSDMSPDNTTAPGES